MSRRRSTAGDLRSVTVAILSWNGRKHLSACLEALAEQEDPGVAWNVVVLDNGSRDGTVEWLEREWGNRSLGRGPRQGHLDFESSSSNLGFCVGNNRLVQACGSDAVALLNNDTRPDPRWLGELVEALAVAPPDVAAVSGLIVDWDAKRLDFARGILTFDGHAFQLGYGQPLEKIELPADGEELLFACGGNMLIRRSSFLDAGGFDPTYFAYLEDVDLGWRLWSGGERIRLARRAVAAHRSMASSANLGIYRRGFLFERNALLTAYKNYDEDLWGRMMPAVLLTFLSRTEALLAENNPGGGTLRVDPYAEADAGSSSVADGELAPAQPREKLLARWRRFGTRQMLRRAVHKSRRLLARRIDPSPPSPEAQEAFTEIRDERSLAQLRAASFVLRHLDGASAERARIQQRRRRTDREIFERFPLYLVPTYPGDRELFASCGFRGWLPPDLALKERSLEQVMEHRP